MVLDVGSVTLYEKNPWVLEIEVSGPLWHSASCFSASCLTLGLYIASKVLISGLNSQENAWKQIRVIELVASNP